MDAWPADSSVRFRRYWMRYRMDLPAVLRGVNLDIPAGSRLSDEPDLARALLPPRSFVVLDPRGVPRDACSSEVAT